MAEYTEAQLNEIDRRVATEIMGWHLEIVETCVPDHSMDREFVCWVGPGAPDLYRWIYDLQWQSTEQTWRPTRNGGQAMEVLEKEHLDLRWEIDHQERYWARATAWGPEQTVMGPVDIKPHDAKHYDVRLAICLAALKKAGVEV